MDLYNDEHYAQREQIYMYVVHCEKGVGAHPTNLPYDAPENSIDLPGLDMRATPKEKKKRA